MDANELLGVLAIAIGGPAGVGAIFFWLVRGLVNKIDKIQPLEQRVVSLEGMVTASEIKNNKTAEEVIRMSEQIKYLTQEVRRLTDFITARMLGVENNNNNG
jgi:hypothetical protein